jgi:hypothetical protein
MPRHYAAWAAGFNRTIEKFLSLDGRGGEPQIAREIEDIIDDGVKANDRLPNSPRHVT